jgi:hypothetical protein
MGGILLRNICAEGTPLRKIKCPGPGVRFITEINHLGSKGEFHRYGTVENGITLSDPLLNQRILGKQTVIKFFHIFMAGTFGLEGVIYLSATGQ